MFPGTFIRGFAAAGYGQDTSTDLHRGYDRGFYLENVDLVISPDFGNRVRFLAEINLEPDFETQSIGIDAERAQLGYVFSNYLSAWVGRFHTPLGFWVLSYHHGDQLQTSVDRPRFLDWEDHYGVIPVHTNGLWLTGETYVGENRLGYMGWIGNGDRMVTDSSGFTNLDFNLFHDTNHDTALGGRVTWFFGGPLSGLQVGFSALREQVDFQSGSGVLTYENGAGVSATDVNPNTGTTFASLLVMLGMHAVYEGYGFEVLNEIYNFENSNLSISNGPTYSSWAGYSQLGYTLAGKFTPYFRYERGDFNVNDPYFYGQYNGLPYGKAAAGLRYAISENSAVKIELSHTYFNASSPTNDGQSFNEVRTSYAIAF